MDSKRPEYGRGRRRPDFGLNLNNMLNSLVDRGFSNMAIVWSTNVCIDQKPSNKYAGGALAVQTGLSMSMKRCAIPKWFATAAPSASTP